MTWRPVVFWVFVLGCVAARATEVIPPAPPAYFNDYAGVVDAGTASSLNRELDQFERETSNQLVVAIYPKLNSDSSVEDFTVRTAQAWHAGQQGKNNGAVLFVFVQSHQMYIQVGYGLESVIPDATAKEIIREQITPAFRTGNYGLGLTNGVHALMAAAKNEYHGSGRTEADSSGQRGVPFPLLLVGFGVLIVISRFMSRRGTVYQNAGRRVITGPWIFPGGGFGGGSGFGGSGGGGGFSGGGGSFGGGGAGGSW